MLTSNVHIILVIGDISDPSMGKKTKVASQQGSVTATVEPPKSTASSPDLTSSHVASTSSTKSTVLQASQEKSSSSSDDSDHVSFNLKM